MNHATLQIRMNYIEGALIRLLGLAGRRGFEILRVEAHREGGLAGGEDAIYEIILELRGVRTTDTLQKQIAKMYDVKLVRTISLDDPRASIRLHSNAPRAVAAM